LFEAGQDNLIAFVHVGAAEATNISGASGIRPTLLAIRACQNYAGKNRGQTK
jgi:hypothetical protein